MATLVLQEVAFDALHEPAIRAVRKQVFTDEQQVPEALDFDGTDLDASHLLITADGAAVATGRILSDGHIGRIAVLPAYRGQGLGVRLMAALINIARSRAYPRVFLGAQRQAEGFYLKLGFRSYGDTFLDAGIPHIAMEKLLS